MASKSNNYYVVWSGKVPGIYRTWAECQEQTNKFPNAKFEKFTNEIEAKKAFEAGWKLGSAKKKSEVTVHNVNNVVANSISVDAACSGNPGVLEFRGVDTTTGEQIFYYGPFPKGTNNIGEFLGVVVALNLLKNNGENDKPVYTDSQTAMAWVRNKKVTSNLIRDDKTEKLWLMIEKSIEWLNNNAYKNPILKWQTSEWGEIRADFGRKTTGGKKR